MTIQEKIQQINALNSQAESLKQCLEKNNQIISKINIGDYGDNAYHEYRNSYVNNMNFFAKTEHIRHALDHAIQDMGKRLGEIEKELAELIK